MDISMVHDLGVLLLGIAIGMPLGVGLNAWLKVKVVPVLIRHGWR